MKRIPLAVSMGLLALLVTVGPSLAEDGTYKGRVDATGATCRGNTHFDVEATVTGDKLEGTLQGSAFRGPVKFSGSATPTSFNASLVFQNLNNLRSDIAATRVDAENYTVTVKFNGGGPNNCEGTGPVKKG